MVRQTALVAIGFVVGVGLCVASRPATAQDPAQKAQSVGDFPDLYRGLKETPGCLDVKVSGFGKQRAIFAWFKNKEAVNAWYNSPMHRGAMRRFFPNMPGKANALEGFKDEKSPLLVVATVTPSDKPTIEGSNLAVSQIAIEIYTPVPGGVVFGGGFGPDSLAVPGMVRLPAGGG